MTRLFAIAMLAAFAAGPSMKWLCEQTCGAGHLVAADEDCHGADDGAQVLLAGHDCGDHVTPVAVGTQRLPSASFGVPLAESVAIFGALSADPRLPDFILADSSPPFLNFLVPLRI